MDSTLKPGQVVKMPDESVWYVDYVNASGAYIVPVTGYETEIVTSKRTGRQRKRVVKYLHPRIVSARSVLEIVDPKSLNMGDVMRRVMARKEGVEKVASVESADGKSTPSGRAPRAQVRYLRTNKEAKEGKGQGRLVLDVLNATTKPLTVEDIANQIKGGLQTRQDPQRVVGYYMSKFKREGIVNAIEPEKTTATETVSA